MAMRFLFHATLTAFSFLTASCLSSNGENLVLRHAEEKSDESKLYIAHSPSYVTFLPNAGAIPSSEISSVMAMAMGFSSTKEVSWGGLLAGDVFRRPKANVLITVDGMSQEYKFDVPGSSASFPVTKVVGSSSLAGILSTSSVTQENLAGRVSDAFGGKSLTVSVSGSELLAAAGYASGENSHTLFWSQAEEHFKRVEPKHVPGLVDLAPTKDQIMERFKKANHGKDVKYSSSSKVFTVSVPGKGNAVFNVEKKEDFLLFAEVEVILQLVERLSESSNLVQDGIPDVFTLSFSALKGLRRRYGDQSLQVAGAVAFLKQVIPQIVKKFADLYDGNVLVEVLTLECDLNMRYPQEVQLVYQEVQPHLTTQSVDMFHDQLPSVALREDLEEPVRQSLCESLQSKLLSIQSPLRVTCGWKHRERRAAASPTVTSERDTHNLAHEYDKNYPVIFNICLWLMIALLLSVYAICVVMWYMDPGRDGIIYRMTSQRIKTE